MEKGKPAGVRCIQLDAQERCKLFDDPRRPRVCGSLQPSPEMCGINRDEALHWLTQLEQLTATPPSRNTKTRLHTHFRCDATNMPL